MITPDTIRTEVVRRIAQEQVEAQQVPGTPRGIYHEERAEALQELDQWIAGEMAKEARQYIRETLRQHYEKELENLNKGEV